MTTVSPPAETPAPPAAEAATASQFAAPALMASAALGVFGWLFAFDGAGAPGQPAALVFPPGWSEARIVAASASLDVDLIGPGGSDSVMLVVPRGAHALDRAREAGVLLVLNATVAALCAGGR